MSARCVLVLCAWLLAASAAAQDFTYDPPGVLVPGSGEGRADDMVYVPGMRFPIEEAPAYPNSQVWGVGGSEGPSGSQCDERNFSYPWHDNFCESRSWDMPLCPAGTGHQGQDIRASTCDRDTHWAVAAEDGVISSIGSYTVYLTADSGTLHRYLHMEVSSLAVREGQRVARGDHMGRVSNNFGGTATTVHLHFDQNQYISGLGAVFVPPYMSLVAAYEELLGMEAAPCFLIPAEGTTLDDAGPCFRQYGPPDYWRVEDGPGIDGSTHWTNAWDGDHPGNWAQWRLFFETAGTYRVEVDVVPPFNLSTQVPYRVRHAGEETDVVVDQSAATDWIELGVFDFDAGGDQVVSIFDNSGESASDLHITADALRITAVGTGMPDAGLPDAEAMPDAHFEDAAGPDAAIVIGAEPEPEDRGCGCVAAGATRRDARQGGFAFGLVALFGILLARRRRL